MLSAFFEGSVSLFVFFSTESFFFLSRIYLKNLLCYVLLYRVSLLYSFINFSFSYSSLLFLFSALLSVLLSSDIRGRAIYFRILDFLYFSGTYIVFDFYFTPSFILVSSTSYFYALYNFLSYFYCLYSLSNDFLLLIEPNELMEGDDFILK